MRGRSVKFVPLSLRVFLPVYRAQFVQGAEDFVRQRNDYVLHRFRQLFNIDMLRDLGALNAQDQATRVDFKYLGTGHWELRLLISCSYSGLMKATLSRTTLGTIPTSNILTPLNRTNSLPRRHRHSHFL
jgi:hypothetical protein